MDTLESFCTEFRSVKNRHFWKDCLHCKQMFSEPWFLPNFYLWLSSENLSLCKPKISKCMNLTLSRVLVLHLWFTVQIASKSIHLFIALRFGAHWSLYARLYWNGFHPRFWGYWFHVFFAKSYAFAFRRAYKPQCAPKRKPMKTWMNLALCTKNHENTSTSILSL